MAKDVYQRLRRHLDNLPGGYPSTESGVELRILRRLFTPEEAELALKLTVIPEPGPVVARRAKQPLEQVTPMLDDMAKKGLIFRYEYKGQVMYMAAQYVIGIWEYHVNDLDPELIKDMNEYIPHLFKPEDWQKAPQLRTIPVERSLTPQHEVTHYEAAEELVRAQKKFLVAPCICRREHEMIGEGCDKPQESCLVFGAGVDYYEANGLGRRIDMEEALAIIKQAAASPATGILRCRLRSVLDVALATPASLACRTPCLPAAGCAGFYEYVCRDGLERSRQAVYGELDPEWDIYQQVEHIFRSGLKFALKQPQYIALYLNVASAGMSEFADRMSREVESFTAGHLKKLLRKGINEGKVRPDIDVNLAAFLINSLYIMFLASLASRHFQIRMKVYLEIKGRLTARNLEQHLSTTIEQIHTVLRPAPPAV
jgi:hypothetical protein